MLWHTSQTADSLVGSLGQTSQEQLKSIINRLLICILQCGLEVWTLETMHSTKANMEQLQLSSRNTTINTNVSQPSKRISQNIAKPFPNLPFSKLNLQFFPLQSWQPWQPASCSVAAKVALATASTLAASKE